MPTAIDIESDARCKAPQPIVCVSIANLHGAQLFTAHDPYLEDVVHHVFEDGAIFAFAPNDVMMLLRKFPRLLPVILAAYNSGNVHDVLTREKKIDIAEGMFQFRGGYDLDAVAERRAGIRLDKGTTIVRYVNGPNAPPVETLPVRLRYHEVAHLTDAKHYPHEFFDYAIKDPIATFAVYMKQEELRARHTADVFRCSAVEASAHLALFAQQLIGINVDRQWTDQLARDIAVHLRMLESQLVQFGLARQGGTKKAPKIVKNQKAAQQMMLATGHAKMTKPSSKHPHGQVKVDATTVKEAMLPVGHPLRVYGDLATLQATASKNLPPLMADRVFTKYQEIVATGRTSSSAPDEDDGTNWQNLPRPPSQEGKDRTRDLMGRFRGCLIPPPGYVFGISDLSGVELGTFADTEFCWFGKSVMGDVINSGRNAHVIFACDLLGIDESIIDVKNNPEHKDARQLAKVKNFGSLGGMGPDKFQRHLFAKWDIYQPIEVTRQQHQMWLRRWQVRAYFDKIKSLADHEGYITIVEPRTGFIRGRMRYTEACNFPFQSKAAYAAKLGLWWLFLASLDPRSVLHGSWQSIFVHDENVSCFRRDVAAECLIEQNRIMELACHHVCPSVRIGVEGHLEERYGK